MCLKFYLEQPLVQENKEATYDGGIQDERAIELATLAGVKGFEPSSFRVTGGCSKPG